MAQKCRICGYRFKAGDGSLCPECFTAREEELRFDIRGSKNDDLFGRGRKESVGDFLADEMKQELHEDIEMKKSLDREDAAKTRNFTAQGGHVKNESFKEAFQERRSRDRSTPGRVYSPHDKEKSAAKQNGSANPAVNSFLDSIDPTLRQRIYGGAQQQDQSKLRYYHHNSFQDLTSNQEMLYGLNAGKAPDDPARQAQIYNFHATSANRTNYSKGSNSKAVAVIIICVAVFIFLVNIFEAIGDSTSDEANGSSKSINEVNVEAPTNKAKTEVPDDGLSMNYGGYIMRLSGYGYGKTGIDALGDPEYLGKSFPADDWGKKGNLYDEMILEFDITPKADDSILPELNYINIDVYNSDDKSCRCFGYDDIQIPNSDKEGEYRLTMTFLIPQGAERYDFSLSYSSEKNPMGFSELKDVTLDLIDKQGKKEK